MVDLSSNAFDAIDNPFPLQFGNDLIGSAAGNIPFTTDELPGWDSLVGTEGGDEFCQFLFDQQVFQFAHLSDKSRQVRPD